MTFDRQPGPGQGKCAGCGRVYIMANLFLLGERRFCPRCVDAEEHTRGEEI